MNKSKARASAKAVVLVALFAALLTAGKLAFAAIPNVEPVTLLLLLYATVFGRRYALGASMIFCAVECTLFGFGSWVIVYFVYWNAFALGASFLPKGRVYLALPYCVLSTAFFGVLSTLVDTLFAIASPLSTLTFGTFFALTYLKGVGFYLTHVISNALIVLLVYPPLYALLTRLKPHFLTPVP